MIDGTHPNVSLALDIADKAIKAAAVIIGGLWTWWNYRKGRTYEQKLEIDLSGNLFLKRDLFIEVSIGLKNIGGTKHLVEQEGTVCEIIVIRQDLSEETVLLFPVFTEDELVEPGESIHDLMQYRINIPADELIWLRLDLRVVSGGVEWRKSSLVRVDTE